jgi:hypothetical protein
MLATRCRHGEMVLHAVRITSKFLCGYHEEAVRLFECDIIAHAVNPPWQSRNVLKLDKNNRRVGAHTTLRRLDRLDLYASISTQNIIIMEHTILI